MEASLEANLERAFGLAYFFHPDRELALGIAAGALSKLRLAERAQARRRYYLPRGRRLVRRPGSTRLRTKVSVERGQLLQRLVLIETDAVERRQEERFAVATLPDDQLILRFVRHLVRIAARRNSLYVAVAMGRVLHGYGSAELLDLYSVVIQDPERVPDDSYVRWVKQGLFREVKERFGELLRTRTGARGEEVFETIEPSPGIRDLVLACLELLTPWDTRCVVPAHFDPLNQTLTSLRSLGQDPDNEHPIEVRRMHSLIHPECLRRLTQGLRFASPLERLRVPQLFKSSSADEGGGSAGDRLRPPALVQRDLDALGRVWAAEDQARQDFSATQLALRVDGRERARLKLAAGTSVRFELEEGAEWLEVAGIGEGPEVPLAAYLLGPEASDRGAKWTQEVTVDLPGGRALRLSMTREAGEAGVPVNTQVTAGCRPSGFPGRLRNGWRRLTDPWAPSPRRWAIRAIPAVVVLGLATSLWVLRGPTPIGTAPGAAPALRATRAETESETTRGARPSQPPVTLATVRRVFLGSLSGPDADVVARLLRRRVLASGRFELTTDPAAADAAFKGRLESAAPGACRLDLQLVDERGQALWSVREDAADCATATERAVSDLLREVERVAKNDGR